MWKTCILIVIFFYFYISGLSSATIRNVSLLVDPPSVRRGQHATFICSYDLDGSPLYSVKFYRGIHEFYRYSPSELPTSKVFQYLGFNVDVSTQISLSFLFVHFFLCILLVFWEFWRHLFLNLNIFPPKWKKITFFDIFVGKYLIISRKNASRMAKYLNMARNRLIFFSAHFMHGIHFISFFPFFSLRILKLFSIFFSFDVSVLSVLCLFFAICLVFRGFHWISHILFSLFRFGSCFSSWISLYLVYAKHNTFLSFLKVALFVPSGCCWPSNMPLL